MIKSKLICDLPPKQGNPRNSEGAFIKTSDGRILFFYSRFKGDSCCDSATSDIYMKESVDGGESFHGEYPVLICEEENALTLMSVSLLQMQNGDIGLFYGKKEPGYQGHMFLRRSSDNGKTWSPAVQCIKEQGYFVVNNDRVIRLSDGSILIVASQHQIYADDTAENSGKVTPLTKISPGMVRFFISRDDGINWEPIGGYNALPMMSHCDSGLQEPGVIELENGIIWCYCRTDLGRQYEMFSFDSGSTWSLPTVSRFWSPTAPMSLKRTPQNSLLAIWNPIPTYEGRSMFVDGAFTGGRTPLVFALSYDEGKTFTKYHAIEDQADRGFCYTAMFFTNDALLLAYCAGGAEDRSVLARTRIRKILFSELNKNTD